MTIVIRDRCCQMQRFGICQIRPARRQNEHINPMRQCHITHPRRFGQTTNTVQFDTGHACLPWIAAISSSVSQGCSTITCRSCVAFINRSACWRVQPRFTSYNMISPGCHNVSTSRMRAISRATSPPILTKWATYPRARYRSMTAQVFSTVLAPTDDAIGRGVRDPPPLKSAIGTPTTCPAMSQHAIYTGDFAYRCAGSDRSIARSTSSTLRRSKSRRNGAIVSRPARMPGPCACTYVCPHGVPSPQPVTPASVSILISVASKTSNFKRPPDSQYECSSGRSA